MLYLGFLVHEDGSLVAPCGCPQCNDRVQPEHYHCGTSPDELIEDEAEQGGCYRIYTEDRWVWYVPLSKLI